MKTENQIKYTWSIKESKKDSYEIYNHHHVLRTICKMGNEFHGIKVKLNPDYENTIVISFDGHYTHILKNVGRVIDCLRAYIEHNKGELKTWEEEKSEEII
jgi:hypothetical protein|tara:strand:+ start:165 stop:467 length:303 start_codon:yes stop_codon:yes gene_type:complete